MFGRLLFCLLIYISFRILLHCMIEPVCKWTKISDLGIVQFLWFCASVPFVSMFLRVLSLLTMRLHVLRVCFSCNFYEFPWVKRFCFYWLWVSMCLECVLSLLTMSFCIFRACLVYWLWFSMSSECVLSLLIMIMSYHVLRVCLISMSSMCLQYVVSTDYDEFPCVKSVSCLYWLWVSMCK